MADDAFALSPISARASMPTEADFEAICGAFMETARGRWFGEYAKRNRNADTLTLLFAFFVVLYASSQVDKKKVGRLALAIQVAFQEMGVFDSSSTRVPVLEDPMPFNTVQSVDTMQRSAGMAQIVGAPGGALGGGRGNGDLMQLQHELESTLAMEISKRRSPCAWSPTGS